MSLRLRLLGLFAVLVLVAALAAGAVTVSLWRVEANRRLVSERLQPASVQSRALLVALVDQETGQRGYLLTGDEMFLEPYRAGRVEFAARLRELRADFRGDAGDDRVAGPGRGGGHRLATGRGDARDPRPAVRGRGAGRGPGGDRPGEGGLRRGARPGRRAPGPIDARTEPPGPAPPTTCGRSAR